MKKMPLLFSVLLLMLTFKVPLIASQDLADSPAIEAPSAMIIDSENGQILFQQESKEMIEVGSITKLLTVYIALSAIEANSEQDFKTLVPISDAAYELSQNYDISNVPLRQDYQYSVNELVESIAVNLANGSTLALAEFTAGSEAAFVRLMEEQLAAWGLTEYQLINATGLPRNIDSGATNALSAEVVATIAYHLVNEFPHYLEFSQQAKAVFKPNTPDRIDMNNYNQMLINKPFADERVIGLMPGSANEMTHSFVSLAQKDDFGVIGVVLGSASEDSRYEASKNLLDYAFSAYGKEDVITAQQAASQIGRIEVVQGEATEASPVYGEDLSIVVAIIDTLPRLEYQFEQAEELFNESNQLVAPLDQYTRIGTMTVVGAGTETEYIPSAKGNKVSVVLGEAISEANWWQKTWNGVTNGIGNAWESTRSFFVDLFN